jgi:hypothetical protein
VNRFVYVLAAMLAVSQLGGCPKPTPAKAAVKKPRGTLVVIGAPEGAIVTIDERNAYPLSSKSRLNLTVGDHRVTIECDGFFPMYQLVTIKEKEETSLTALLQPSMPD